jgi:phenylpropionate dioxygenase-like ring-hydroxylating dioxygenase large terminal subunit
MPRYPFPIPYGWFQACWPDDVPTTGAYEFPGVGRQLAAVRTDTGFEVRDRRGDRTYPTIERNGLVMFWYHPSDAPPTYEIPELAEFGPGAGFSEPVRRFTPRINALWQELGETAADVAHIQQHLAIYGAETPGEKKRAAPTIVDTSWDGPHGYLYLSQPFPTPRGAVEGRIDTDSYGPGFSVTWFTGLIDTGLIGCNLPLDEESTAIRFTFVCRQQADSASTSRLATAFMDEIHHLAVEDLEIWEHKAYLARPCLANTDGPIMAFRRWAAQFYVDDAVGDPTAARPLATSAR